MKYVNISQYPSLLDANKIIIYQIVSKTPPELRELHPNFVVEQSSSQLLVVSVAEQSVLEFLALSKPKPLAMSCPWHRAIKFHD